MKKGFTLIEVILVLGLVAIIGSLSVLYYQDSQVRADINTQVSQFASYMRLARSNAISGLDGENHGVHLESDSYTLFSGGSYNPDDPDNFVVELPGTIAIQNIFLNGGVTNIIFSGPDGETNHHGTIDFRSAQINKTITVTISSLGTITY